MRLNEAGRVVERCWLCIPSHFPHAALDTFIVMPNHVHGIILLSDAGNTERLSPTHDRVHVGANDHSPLQPFRSPSRTIGSIVRGFKIGVTKWFRQHTDVLSVWQRNYYEHVIRDEQSLIRIREYIAGNPARWAGSPVNPAVVGKPRQRTPGEPWRP